MTPGHAEELPEGPLMGAPTTPSDRQHSGPLCIRHPICAMTYVMTTGLSGTADVMGPNGVAKVR
jgi:hypothetical protein